MTNPVDPDAFKETVLGTTCEPNAFPSIGRSGPGPIAGRFGMIGNSPRMQKLYEVIERFSSVDCCVAILGASGTGKELVAKAIHDSGRRRSRPFVPVDCAALTPSLIEAELFGHVRGAFTGAFANRQGPLAGAKDGTVFLDEIGELPLELQAKLLRALQERTVRPVGANDSVCLQARFVVATNKDLRNCVTNGTFRPDLFFRLMGGQISVPALRDRKMDIPLLVATFLEEANKMRGTKRTISDAAMRKLMLYFWPGNVRELKSAIHRSVILSNRQIIEIEDLPAEITETDIPWNLESGVTEKATESFNLAELELGTIRRALSEAHGDKGLTAKMLGIGKTTLYRKLNKIEQNERKALRSVS